MKKLLLSMCVISCSEPYIDVRTAESNECPYGGSVLNVEGKLYRTCNGQPGIPGEQGPEGAPGEQGQDLEGFGSIVDKILPYDNSLVGLLCCTADETVCGSGSGYKFNSEYYLTASHVLNSMSYCSVWNQDGLLVGISTVLVPNANDYGWVQFTSSDPAVPSIRGYVPILGERLVVVGHPGVYNTISWENQYTYGYVTSVNPDETLLEVGGNDWINAFITDAVSWHGNSGGAVFNQNGFVVGLLVGGYNGADVNAGPDLGVVIPIP